MYKVKISIVPNYINNLFYSQQAALGRRAEATFQATSQSSKKKLAGQKSPREKTQGSRELKQKEKMGKENKRS